eukprot:4861062-Alexandrium_andersonii.AAC.1
MGLEWIADCMLGALPYKDPGLDCRYFRDSGQCRTCARGAQLRDYSALACLKQRQARSARFE